MVRIFEDKLDLEHVDFSFIPSLRCNNTCWFCMYCASEEGTLTLNLEKTVSFVKTIDWDRVSSCGFYGGEPSISMSLYQKFIDITPKILPRFVITNGKWSLDHNETELFLRWCSNNKLWVKVSGTLEHKKCQHRLFLENIEKELDFVRLKDDDELHPMGRLATTEWCCTEKCKTHKQPTRLAIFPTGDILLQNCDGVYPVIGTYHQEFKEIFDISINVRKSGCGQSRNLNDVLLDIGALAELDIMHLS